MVSDLELVDRLRQILSESDLDTTTAAGVRRQLEEEFAVSLRERKAFVREQIDIFVREQQNDAVQEEEEKNVVQNDVVKEEENVKEEDEEEDDGEDNMKNEEEEEEEGEEEEEEDEDEEVTSKMKKRSKKADGDVKRKGGGFSKPCALSPQLQELLGVDQMPRTEVVKELWAYIKKNNLQNPDNKRKIMCDEDLQAIFRVNSIDMFQMNKALSKHIWPLDEIVGSTGESSEKERQRKGREKGSDEPKRKEKPKKGGGSGFTAPIPISDALMKFLGTGETELSRAEVVKKMWHYIKENELQDPSDKRMVLCDEKLKELLDVDSFRGFGISKLLTPHFIKPEE